MTAKNLGTGGSSLNAQFGDGTTSSTFPIHLEHVETDYLYLPGNSRNFAALAPSPSLEFVGDIDVSVRVALDNWTAADQTLIGRGYGNGYWFYTTATNIHFSIALASGGNIYPGVAWSSRPANGSSIWLRATRVASTGVVTFYSGVDGPNEPSWTLIGTITSTSGNMGYPGSHPVGIGAATQAGGSFAHATGKFYRVIIRNGINGTKVADVDFTTGLESGGQYSIINTSSDKRGIYASTVENLGTGGAQLDAISGTAVDTTTNDPLWLGIEESKFVRTPGVAGNYISVPHSPSLNILGTEGTPFLSLPGPTIGGQYASTPDTAALDITGDIDVRCRAQLARTTPLIANANLVTKGGLGGNYAYFFGVDTAGQLFFEWSNNGGTTTFKTSTVAATVPAGVPYWYRATMDADNGAGGNDIAFYVSPDGITWTQVGDTVTTAGVAVINNSASALQLGGYGGTCFTDGRIYRAQVRNGINGTVVFDADFTQQALGSRGFIESTGKLVTLDGNAAQIVDGTTYGFSPGVAGANWIAADTVPLSITGNIDIRVRLSANDWSPGDITPLVSKYNITGAYAFQLRSDSKLQLDWVSNAPAAGTGVSSAAVPFSDGQTGWVRASLEVNVGGTNHQVRFYHAPDSETEPTVWTEISPPAGAGVTNIRDTADTLIIGTNTSLSVGLFAGRVYRVIIRPNLTSGTKAFDADFTRQLQFASTFTEGSANLATVTTQGAARIERDRDLDLRVKVAMDDWTPTNESIVLAKWNTEYSYFLAVSSAASNNRLLLGISPTINAVGSQFPLSTESPTVANGEPIWIRATLDVNNGANGYTVRYYTSPDGLVWTQLGLDRTFSGAISTALTTTPIEMSTANGGTSQFSAGKFYNAEIRNGINGPAVLDLDFSNSITIKNQKYIPGDSFSTIPEAEQFLPNLGTGGTALNARYGASIAAEPTTSDPLLLTHTGTNYLYLPGVLGNRATSPSAAALNPSTASPLRIEVDVALDQWKRVGQQNLAHLEGDTYDFSVWDNGTLLFFYFDSAVAYRQALSTTAVPFRDGERGRVAVEVTSGGVITFFVSYDGVTWSQLEASATTGGSGFRNTQGPLNIGSYTNTLRPATGKFYRATIKHSGTVVFDANFTTGITSGAQTTFTESSPNAATVTINRSTSGRKSVAVVQDVLLFGADDYLEVPDNDLLDFGATDSFTVMTAVRQWATPTVFGMYVSKRNVDPYWLLASNSNLLQPLGDINTGISQKNDVGPTYVAGATTTLAMRIDRSTQEIESFTGGVGSGSPDNTASVGSLVNPNVVRVGATGFGAPYADMEFRGSAVWRRALTSTELALVNTHYTTGPTTESTKLLQEAVWWVDSSIRNVAQINQTNILNPAQAKIDGAYVYTPGTAGNYVAVPHSPSLNILGTEGTPRLSLQGEGANYAGTAEGTMTITSDIDIIARVSLNPILRTTHATIVSARQGSAAAFQLRTNINNKRLQFVWWQSLVALEYPQSTADIPFADNEVGWVRVTMDESNPANPGNGWRVQFFTAPDSISVPTVWTQLGVDINGTAPAGIVSTTSGIQVGGIGFETARGDFYRAIVRNGIGGPAVFDADFTQQALGSRGFIESTGKLVSLVGNAAQIVDGTTYGFMPGGTGSGWTVPEDNDLDLNSFEIIARLSLNDWATTAINQAIVAKYTNTQIGGVAQRTYIFRVNGRDLLLDYVLASDPTSGSAVKLAYTQGDFLDSTNFANGKIGWIRVTRNKDTGVIQFFKAADSETIPTSWTQATTLGDQLTGDLYNSNVVTSIGAFNESLSGYTAAGRFYRAIINNNSSGGTKVLDADFTRQIQFASTFTEGSSQLATVTTGSISRIERDRDLDIRVKVALDDWTPGSRTLLSKSNPASVPGYSYLFYINSSNQLALAWSTDGSTVQIRSSGSALTIPDGTVEWVRATLDVNNGSNGHTATFYTSDDGTTWTVSGSASTVVGATSTIQSTTPVYLMAQDASDFSTVGKVFNAEIRNGIDGPAILDIDFSDTLNTGGESYIQDTQLEAIPEAEQFLPNLGWGGTALNARYGASVAAEPNTHDPLLLTHTGTNYLYLPGVAGNWASTDHYAALNVTGDLEVVAHLAMDDWTPATPTDFIGRGNTDPNRGWMFRLESNGSLTLYWWPTGLNASVLAANNAAPVPFADGLPGWLKVTLDVDNGAGGRTITFFVSNDGVTWAQLGAPVIQAGTTSLPTITSGVQIRGDYIGAAPLSAKVYRAQVRNGINGTVIFDTNFSTAITSGAQTTLTAASASPSFVFSNPNSVNTNYLRLPGATKPTDCSIDVRVECTRPTIPTGSPYYQRPFQWGYYFTFIDGDTFAVSFWASDGTFPGLGATKSSLDAIALPGSRIQIRSTWDATTDTLSVLARPGGQDITTNTGWTLLNSTVAAGKQINTGDLLTYIGFGDNDTAFNGQTYDVAVYINNSLTYRVRADDYPTSGTPSTFTASSGQTVTIIGSVPVDRGGATVTINRSTSGRKSVAVVQDILLFGSDDYLEVPDNDLLDFGASDSFTVMTAVRGWGASSPLGALVMKRNGLGSGQPGWAIYQNGSPTTLSGLIGDALAAPTFTNNLSPASGALTLAAMVRNVATDQVSLYNTTAVTDGTTATLANGQTMQLGRSSSGFADMEFRGSAIWRRALTAAELALVNTHYATGPTAASTALMQEAVWWIDAGIRSVAQINRSLSGLKTTAVAKDSWLFGTDKFLQVLNNDALNFKENESFTALAVIRHWPTVQDKRLLSKISLGSGLPQWWLGQVPNDAVRLSMTSNWVQYPTADTRLSPGVLSAVVGIRNVSTDTLSITAAGSTVSTSDTTTGTLVNTVPLLVGAQPGGVYADMEFYGGAIWRRVLTSQEIALINTHYTTGPTTASNALLQEAVWWIDAKQSRSGAGISRSTSGLKSVTVTRPTWLVGNGRYFEVSDNNLLDANATQSFSIFAVVRQWPNPTNYGMYVNKVDSSIGDKGYLLGGHETNNALYAAIDDQPTPANRFDQATKPGKLQMVCMVVDRSVQTLRTYVDGVAGTVANIVSVGSLETGVPLRIGRTASGGTALHADVEIVSVGLFRRALTDKEVIDISAYYGTSNPINEATVLTGEDGNYLLLENGEPIIIE